MSLVVRTVDGLVTQVLDEEGNAVEFTVDSSVTPVPETETEDTESEEEATPEVAADPAPAAGA